MTAEVPPGPRLPGLVQALLIGTFTMGPIILVGLLAVYAWPATNSPRV